MWQAIQHWHSTPEERVMVLPCDAYLSVPYRSFHRAIDIDAPVSLVFRWLSQLKLAPYSYDWIDNAGRRSPRSLTPGVEHLAVGQPFLITTIVEFEVDRQISGQARPEMIRPFGHLALTYLVRPGAASGTRLLVRMNVGMDSRAARVRAPLLAAGDLLMMRKQLRNLKALAQRDARAARR